VIANQTDLIDSDWQCMDCGYNLRGLSATGNCPECNQSTDYSLQCRPLSHADRRWLKRIQLGFSLLLLMMLYELAVPFSVYEEIASKMSWYARQDLDASDISRIMWPLLLLPAARLFRKPERFEDRREWPVRFLLPVLLIHLAVAVAMPVLRLLHYADLLSASLLLMFGLETCFSPIEFWLVISVALRISARIPTNPMHWESTWFRRVFCTLLALDSADWMLVMVASIIRMHHHPARGEFALPEPWGLPMSNVSTVVHFALMPMWFYLVVFLLRFKIVVRRAGNLLTRESQA
jgi:hypothetical protein